MRALPALVVLSAAWASLAGCDCGGRLVERTRDGAVPDGAGPTIAGLTALRIEPADATVETVDGVPGTLGYRAIGTFVTTAERDVTDLVTFSLGGPVNVGTFSGALFTASTRNGGRTYVTTTANGRAARATLTVRIVDSFAVPPTGGAPALPADPGTRFGGPADAARAPTLVYPEDGAILPPNLGRMEIHWLRGPASNTLFEVAFENDVTDVRFHVRCERPAGIRDDGCIWEPFGDQWRIIAETNRGGGPLSVTVRATDDAGTGVGASATREVRFARDPLDGTLYYWSTTRQSIMRYDFGAGREMAMPVLTPDQAAGRCVGCHAITRDGRRILGTVGGIGSGGILLYDLESFTPLRAEPTGHVIQFGSFSPDGAMLVGVFGDDDRAERGLTFFDTRCDATSMPTCGQPVLHVPVEGVEASHPAWSPDGAHIAYTDVGIDSVSQRPQSGAIALVDRTAGDWVNRRFLVPRAGGRSRINPDWAPDSASLVFTESTCPGGDLGHRDCNGDSDPTSTIHAVRLDGGAPVACSAAQRPGALDEGRTELNNTFARFAPFEFVLDSGDVGETRLMWVVFSTTRSYGLRNPPGGNDESGGRGTYLWMFAYLPTELESGADPSHPPFVLPFQDLASSNHIAAWTTEAIGEPPVF